MRRLPGSALLAILLYAANPAAFATQRTDATEEHLVCKKPESPQCVTWQLVGVDPDIIIEESPVNATQFCGLSDLKRILPHRKFITVKSLESHGKPKIVFCKGFTKLKGKVVNWKQVVNALEALNRPRRQTGFVPRGRYRGQTQSQYLAIDRGNGKDEGKAEAHSAADSSRASVSGNSGMGQAQSQSIYDPSCDDCNRHEVESLKRGPPHVTGGGPLENRFGPDGGKIEWTGPGGRDGYGPPGSYGSMPGGKPPTGNNGYRPGQGIGGHNQQGTPGGINGYGPRQGSNIGTNEQGSPPIAGPGYYGSVPGVSNVYRPGPGINNGPTQVDSGGIPRPGSGHYGSVPGDVNGYRPGQGQQGTVGLLGPGGNGPNGPNGRYSPGDRQGGNNGYRPGEQLGGNQVSGPGTQYKPASESAPGYGTDQGLPGSTYGSGPGYAPVQNGLNSHDGLRPGQNYGNVPGLNGQGIVPSRNGFNQGSNYAPNDGQLLIPGQNGGVFVPGKTYTSGQNGLPGVNYGSSQSTIPVGNLGNAPSQGPSTNNGDYVLGKNGMPGSYQTSPGSVNGHGLNNAGPGLGGGSYIPVQGNQIYGPGGTREPANGVNSNIPSSNWPLALGPFTGPPGSSVYCCVVPNNLGNGANIISPSGTYGGGQNAPGVVGGGQPPYGSVPGGVPNNLVGPAYGPSGPGGPNLQGSYNTVVSSGGPAGQVPYGPNHGGQNAIQGPGTYGTGTYGPGVVHGMSGPEIYGAGQRGGPGQQAGQTPGTLTSQNEIPGTGTYGTRPGGSDVQNNVHGPGSYIPGSGLDRGGQNGMQGPGTYSPGSTGVVNGQNGIHGPGTYGPGSIGGPSRQNSMQGPGTYGPGATGGPNGQNGMQGPGTYGPGATGVPNGQNGIRGPGTYGPGATGVPNGQNGMQGPGTYGPGATGGLNGQNSMQGPGTYGPGSTGGPSGQNGMQGPGSYGPGSNGVPSGQNGMQGPGTYGPGATGGSNGQNGMQGPGTYGPGATGVPNGQNGMQGPGTYGPGATGAPNGQNGMQGPGTYGPGATGGPNGQNGMQGPGTYGPGATGLPNGQNGMQGPGTYGPGATGGPNGQNGMQGPGTYGPGATGGPNGQNGMQGPGTYGPGATGGPNGQNGMQGPGTYGPGATGVPNGQNGMQGPGTYGPGETGGLNGQNGMQGPGTYGPGATSGTYIPGGQNGAQGSGPYVPGGLGGIGGPHGMQGPGAYGPGDIGGEQNVAPGQYGNQNGPGGQQFGGGNSGVDQHSSLGNRFGFDSQGNPLHGNGSPQNFVDPNSIAIDGDDSEAEAIVNQALNGTTASASSKGGNDKGRAQTHVHGTYTGGGSFQAQAQITGENKEAESEVSGGKKGASSSATGSGRNNKSQASVQLGSETGSIQTNSQTTGAMHSSNSQVQGSVKGGMADAQARGPGSTSSQAQIGFTPYKDGDKEHDLLKTPFVGGGVSSAQSSGRTGQSQSQLHGTFKYGITYNGAAQAGASLDKDAVFPNRLNFDKINVFDETQKNINVNTDNPQIEYSSTESPVLLSAVPLETKSNVDNEEITTTKASEETMKNSESRYSSHTHLDHHKTDPILEPTSALVGTRRSFQSGYGNTSPDYEYTKDKDEPAPDEYDSDPRYSIDGPAYGVEENDATEVEQTEGEEYPNYDEYARDPLTHQSLLSPKKHLEVQQSTGGNTQHIVLGSLKGHDAEITQKNSATPDETKVYQPGERVPGTGGYRIPMGFTGSVKSVASKENTYVVGTKHSPSQAQSVTLTPGTGKVSYVYPPSYGKYVSPKDLKSLKSRGTGNDDRYVSVSKSVTRALDGENNIRKQYSHTYYTKSSSCGYFTFTCTMVSGVDGRKKVCKPKMPTNPDGTPIRC